MAANTTILIPTPDATQTDTQSKDPAGSASPHVAAPTKEDFDSVRINFKLAQTRDMETILVENHSHLIQKRDEIYEASKKNGITLVSSFEDRLKPIGQVAKYCFFNIEPPNEYTAVKFAFALFFCLFLFFSTILIEMSLVFVDL